MKEAEKGIQENNAPFGSVITDEEGHIIAVAHNTTKTQNDPPAHKDVFCSAMLNRVLCVCQQRSKRELLIFILAPQVKSI